MRVFASIISAVFLGASSAATPPMRVVSTSLCGDAFVLALSDRSQITALSWQADHAVSNAPDWARNLPKAAPDIETLLALNPDLIIFGVGESYPLAPFLARADIPYVEILWGEDFESVTQNYAALGPVLGQSERAAALSADLDDRLRILETASHRATTALYLQRSGGSTGSGTFVDAVLTAAGLDNIMADYASGWTGADPEIFIGLKPDIYILSYMDSPYESANALPLSHGTYRRQLESRPAVHVDGALWPCAGPNLIEAAEHIAREMEALK